ncbi:mitochondrial import inner membrane translocase subunit TIM50 [Nematocida major]|uniref:mitochondrial import inner membrane translocase subunit TIM50 n=1 Tax=Nematocida major TaxID=1912982 RepID=UPI00200836D2|nr:mitochondrial import inner membrane translocase subunit TIM50 [Nematocida major]KAH9386585.1 mitochondrial import inner membrane translocase subunit TIM50 [Nematocida major]
MSLLKYIAPLPLISSISEASMRSTGKFPKYALGVGILLGAGLLARTRPGKRVFAELKTIAFSDRKGSPLPPQETALPTVFIDIDDILVHKVWSFRMLGYEYEVRPNAGAFLFQLSNEYEVVGVTSMPSELSAEVLSVLDPFGCIKYRMHVPDTDQLDIGLTQRDVRSVVRIRSRASLADEVLSFGKWDGQSESGDLMGLLDFLLNLKQLETGDFREVLKTYKAKDFAKAYGEVQKTLHPAKRSLFLFKNPNGAKDTIDALNRTRLQEYELAKAYIENKMKIEKVAKK